MEELVLNKIGKNRLTDDEFKTKYVELWKLTPHFYSNWPSDEEILEQKNRYKEIYNCEDITELTKEDGEIEIWSKPLGRTKYLISTFGRVRYKDTNRGIDIILKQEDIKNKKGYLVLVQPKNVKIPKINTTTCVYTLVAKAFMKKEDGDGLHVHHINNNGYDCSLKNLILLTPSQHNAVHRNRMLNSALLEDFLIPDKRYSDEKIKLHLADYKNNNITTKCGIWQNGRYYSHLVPNEKQNLIDKYYKNAFDDLYKKLKSTNQIHIYFSSLASSQALCFNLFLPICEEKIFYVINPECDKETKWEFEHIEDTSFETCSDRKGRTNFDFFMQSNNKKFFFEIKYTEETFGFVSEFVDGDEHDIKFKQYYQKQLSLITNEPIDERDFFNNYQLWRNICHVKEENNNTLNDVYFVCLRDRKDLIKDVELAKEKCKVELQDHIHILKIESLVKDLLAIDNENIHKHYLEFFEKYLNY